MNIVDIEKMVELIKATEDAEIRAVLLEGLKHQLMNPAPKNPTITGTSLPPYTTWGGAVPCGQNRTVIGL